jgi:4-phytase/acid phosphatase
MKLMGDWYRQWLSGEHLLQAKGCQDAGRIYIRADRDQRTVETGHALAESLAPGCRVTVEAQLDGSSDPLFTGAGDPDPALSLKAVQERLGTDPRKFLDEHRAALDTLHFLLYGAQPRKSADAGDNLSVGRKGKSLEMEGPLANGSTFSENLMLEYAEGMRGPALGWGRLTPENLFRVLELHEAYSELMRRTPYLARVRGSNLLAHVLWSMEQAASGKATPGALGPPNGALLVLSGHDTNLSSLSGMLGLSWQLPGYRRNDTPPGGALVFSLWRAPSGALAVKLRYVAQTLDQMRNSSPLSLTASPAGQDLAVPGCPQDSAREGCAWRVAYEAMRKSVDPNYVSVAMPAAPASQ